MSIVSVVSISIRSGISRPLSNSVGGNWSSIGTISSSMGIWVSNMVGIGGIWVGGIRIGSAGIGHRGGNGLDSSYGRLFGISSLDNGVGNWESIGETITSIGMTITSIRIRISVASVQKSGVSLG